MPPMPFFMPPLSEKQKRRHCRGYASVQKCFSVKEFNVRIAQNKNYVGHACHNLVVSIKEEIERPKYVKEIAKKRVRLVKKREMRSVAIQFRYLLYRK